MSRQAQAGPIAVNLTGARQAQAGPIALDEKIFTGTITVTQSAHTLAASGSTFLVFTGTIAVTQSAHTGALAGVEVFTGSIDVIQSTHTMEASGTALLAITGTINVVQSPHTGALAGVEVFTGTITVTQSAHTMEASGTALLAITGTIDVTQSAHTGEGSGSPFFIHLGTIDVVQSPHTIVARGLVLDSSFRSSPADIVRQLLLDLGLSASAGKWVTYVGFLPDTPDNALCVYDTAGIPDGRIMRTGRQIVHEGIQIRVRGLSYPEVWVKAKMIAVGLDALHKVLVALSSAEAYTLLNVSRTGDIIPAGIEEEGGRRRHHFTVNAVVTIEKG
jgi:hypothetical protein